MENILKTHIKKYPLMTERDAVKLVFQNEFGGGHFVADEKSSLEYLKKEYSTVAFDSEETLFENIGNGYARLNLAAAEKLSPEIINRMFVASSLRKGSMEAIKLKLGILRRKAQSGAFNFSPEALEKYLEKYDYKPVSHSEQYRKAYKPSYRVIDERYGDVYDDILRAAALLAEKNSVILGIDGMAASGKSTAAYLLSSVFDCNVFHMDDFFLPPVLRTPQRFAQIGGNVHYERFKQEVVDGILSGKSFSYRVFDCGKLDYGKTVDVLPKRLSIIEGSYSLHPYFGSIYDMKKIYMTDSETQKKRILERNGERMLERFINEWIPLENKYLRTVTDE